MLTVCCVYVELRPKFVKSSIIMCKTISTNLSTYTNVSFNYQ